MREGRSERKGAETQGCVASQMFLFYLFTIPFIATRCFSFDGSKNDG